MTKQKLDLSQLYKFIKKETLKKNDIAQVFIPLTQNLVKALWQQLQPQIFWGMMQQALHSSILFYFLPFFSLDHLKLCQVGWGPSVDSYL